MTNNEPKPARSEQLGKLANGQITLAEYAGLSKSQLYEIAGIGYQMLNSGKLEEAREIYTGLVAADPYDSVFHCHLGAVYLRQGELEKAFIEYQAALRFNLANVDALAGRGEIFILKGENKRGLEDLRKALENDPEGRRPSTARARNLLLALHKEASKKVEV